jgi:hypothetical protein
MNNFKWTVMLGCAVLWMSDASRSTASEVLDVGVAVVDITPIVGCRMSGYFSERINTGTRDPLRAKALVFRQGEVTGALVLCDISGISLEVSSQARKHAARMTGIPAKNISIAATHSHTGPLYFGALRQHFHDLSLAKKRYDPYELVNYSQELTGRVVRAIIKAQGNLRPVSLKAGYAREERLSFNRRFHMKNGTVRFNPGHLNPNIVRPAGPIDPEVGLVSFIPAGQADPMAALVCFALHLDTLGGTQYSADFPRYLQDHLQRGTSEDFVSCFGIGTCGDVNHADVTVKTRRKTEEIGTMLAETVAARLPTLKPVAHPSLAILSKTLEVPLQSYPAERVAKAKQLMSRVDDRKLSFLQRVENYKIMALKLRGGATIGLEVHAFRLSDDVAIVTLPGEIFVELGIAIKQASPFATTIVIELANDAPGYIPTRKAFAEGSYETVNSRVIPGSGEKLVETATQLLRELASLKTGSLPRDKQAR